MIYVGSFGACCKFVAVSCCWLCIQFDYGYLWIDIYILLFKLVYLICNSFHPSNNFKLLHSLIYIFRYTMSNSTSNAGMDALRQAISSGSNAAAALSAMVAASRGSSSSAAATSTSASAAGSASSSTANEQVDQKPSAQELAKENEGQDDGHEVDDEISYTPYKPAKLKVCFIL